VVDAYNSKRSGGYTALGYGAEYGFVAVVETLIKCGAKVDHVMASIFGTALHVATEHGHLAVVEALLQAGATVDIPNNEVGQTGFAREARIKNFLSPDAGFVQRPRVDSSCSSEGRGGGQSRGQLRANRPGVRF